MKAITVTATVIIFAMALSMNHSSTQVDVQIQRAEALVQSVGTVEPDRTLYTTEPAKPTKETWTATAYCPCSKCCGAKNACNRPNGIVIGAQGTELHQGVSVACPLPFGTVIRITGADEYDGDYVCQDRTANWIVKRYDGKIVDLYFDCHADAEKFGKRCVCVEVLEVQT